MRNHRRSDATVLTPRQESLMKYAPRQRQGLRLIGQRNRALACLSYAGPYLREVKDRSRLGVVVRFALANEYYRSGAACAAALDESGRSTAAFSRAARRRLQQWVRFRIHDHLWPIGFFLLAATIGSMLIASEPELAAAQKARLFEAAAAASLSAARLYLSEIFAKA